MKSIRRALMVLCTLALVGGCGDDSTGTTDAGGMVGTDAGGGGMTDGGGGAADAGGDPDAGGGGMTDGGGGTDAGGGGGTDGGGSMGTVDCMGMSCDAATQICCISGGIGGGTGMCIPNTETCMGATSACDGPEDCGGGEVCCAQAMGLSISASCTTDACGGGFTSFELCHDASDCTDTTQMCCPIMMFGFSGAYCSAMCGFGPPGP